MQSALALPLQQTPQMASVLRRLGCRVRTIDMPGAAPLQVITRFGLSFASRGPVWEVAADPCPRTLRATGISLLNAEQHDPDYLRAAGYRQIWPACAVAEIDLTVPADDRLHRCHPKWRSNLKKSAFAAFDLQWSRFDYFRHGWLLDADLGQQRAKRYRALPHGIIAAWADIYPTDVRVLTACRAGAPVAAMLFLMHAPVATYHIGWSGAAGRACGAHHRMLMRAAADLAEEGFTRIDLGLHDPERTPGLARFKRGSGASIRSLGGTWIRLPGCERLAVPFRRC